MNIICSNSGKEIMEDMLDLISGLPFEILRRILSLLPLEEAVRTSTLSTVWKKVWAPFQVDMDFDTNPITNHEDCKRVIQVIGTILRSYYDCPEVWKLCLNFPESKKDLIVLATKGAENEVHFEFSKREKISGKFKLKLEQTCQGFSNNPTMKASFSVLKTLHLRSVSHLAQDLVSALFSNCQLLESLKIEKCVGLESLDIEAGNSLQNLAVLDCPDIVDLTISAPILKSFSYQGVLPQIHLVNTLNLVNVVLNLKDGLGNNEFDCEEILLLLASLKEVEILTISGWLLEWLCSAGVIFRCLRFQFNKLKELRWIDSLINRAKRDSLACFLNIAPILERLFIKIERTNSSVPCPYFHQYWHEPHLWMDFATIESNTSQLDHLKVVTFLGFSIKEDQLLLMELLLKKASMLNSMSVILPTNRIWRVVKVSLHDQQKQASSNHQNQIAVLSPTKDFFFGFTEEIYSGHCSTNA
ncbi:hypothetical protein ACB092_09G011400 [Castanea dentata]